MWAEVLAAGQHCHIPVGLDLYSIVDLVSISFVKSLGLSPYTKLKYQHTLPVLEGVSEMCPKTYSFFHLKLTITDCFNRLLDFI
jgi:hypothetical protein